MMAAIHDGLPKISYYLLTNFNINTDIFSYDKLCSQILCDALKYNLNELLQYFIQEGFFKNYFNKLAVQNAFLYALENCSLENIKIFTETLNLPWYHIDQYDNNALHIVARRSLTLVKYFINNCSIPVNSQNALLYTPLHFAAMGGKSDIVDYLLNKANADATMKNCNNETPDILAVNPSTFHVFNDYFKNRNIKK